MSRPTATIREPAQASGFMYTCYIYNILSNT